MSVFLSDHWLALSGNKRCIHWVNASKNGKNIMAVLTLKTKLSTALPITGSLTHRKVCVNQMYGQNKTIPITAEITLNITCAKANCLFIVFPPREAKTPVKVVPIFAPITMAIDAGKSITPELIAAKVSTHMALLDCKTTVTKIPIRKKRGRPNWAYCAKSNVCCSISTLSFMKSSHKKSSPNPTSNVDHCFPVFPLVNKRLIHPIARIGKANVAILNSPNHNRATSNEVKVVPILAPMSTPMALLNLIIPAPTKAIAIKETKLLLCNSAVTNVPTSIEFQALLV